MTKPPQPAVIDSVLDFVKVKLFAMRQLLPSVKSMHTAAGCKGDFCFTGVLINGKPLWAKGKDGTVTRTGRTVMEAGQWLVNGDEERNGKRSCVACSFYVYRH